MRASTHETTANGRVLSMRARIRTQTVSSTARCEHAPPLFSCQTSHSHFRGGFSSTVFAKPRRRIPAFFKKYGIDSSKGLQGIVLFRNNPKGCSAGPRKVRGCWHLCFAAVGTGLPGQRKPDSIFSVIPEVIRVQTHGLVKKKKKTTKPYP